ncbi:unnamed protein product [Caenorhabditis sp. 36 PRJEB53466]|nr:unnamed protein product [Caenorhabditis sp. 36 PRJEB53466]
MLMLWFLLVTLLTVSSFSDENVTSITPSINEIKTLETFTLPTIRPNASLTAAPPVIVVNGTEDVASNVSATIGSLEETTLQELDLSQIQQESDDADGDNPTKIETGAAEESAPKMVAKNRTADSSENKIPIVEVYNPDEDSEEDDEDGDDYEVSTTSAYQNVFEKENQDGVPLSTDSDVFTDERINNDTSTYEDTPQPFWDRSVVFVNRFAENFPKTSILTLAVLFSVLVLLMFLVFRECCKGRRNSAHRRPAPTSITADLYNTSTCSHRYTKVTLPDQKEVTMQLMSADCSSETL